MEIKNSKNIKLPVFIFVFLLVFFQQNIFAQDDDYAPGYFMDIIDNEPKFFQRIVWEKDENVLYYEVNILIQDRNGYLDYITETTDNFYLDVSLPAGEYRYNVTPYDLLERRGNSSEYKNFTVIKAYKPVIDRIIPFAFFLDQRLERILHVAGSDFFPDSEFYLRNGFNRLFPVNVTVNENRASLEFNDRTLVTGIYEVYIKNPGGLEATRQGFRIGYRKPMDIFFKMSWLPIMPIYGGLRDLLEPNFFFSGFGIGMEAISSRRSTFNGGLELSGNVYFINQTTTFNVNIVDIYRNMKNPGYGALFGKIDFNIALQKRYFNNLLAATVRFGVGMGPCIGLGYNDITGFVIAINAGFSNQFLLFEIFHLEVGVDYSHYISDYPSGTICPRLGITWKF